MPNMLLSIKRSRRANLDAIYQEMPQMQRWVKKTRLNHARRLAGFYYIFIACSRECKTWKASFWPARKWRGSPSNTRETWGRGCGVLLRNITPMCVTCLTSPIPWTWKRWAARRSRCARITARGIVTIRPFCLLAGGTRTASRLRSSPHRAARTNSCTTFWPLSPACCLMRPTKVTKNL